MFSTEHPIYMAPTRPDWSVDAEGCPTWPVNSYLVEGRRTTDWLAPGVVKYHRTLGTTLNLLIGAGFAIRHVEEFGPTDEQVAAQPGVGARAAPPDVPAGGGRTLTERPGKAVRPASRHTSALCRSAAAR